MLIEATLAATLLAAAVVLVGPDRYAGRLAFLGSLLPLAGSLYMFARYDGSGSPFTGQGEFAFETTAQWFDVGPYAVNWHVGLDGVSMPLFVLTAVLTTLAVLSAWTPIDERQSQFYALMLFLEAALLGVFASLDFLLWFVFWEAVLVPMYFLIGVWGGPRRKYAAIKFFVYTNVASLVMFIGFIALVFALPVDTLDLPTLARALRTGDLSGLAGLSPSALRAAAFLAMFAGFAVKVPVVPVHTWLPDAHVEAPTPVSVLLAGVLLKMGTYALLRFNFTMLPEVAEANATLIAVVGVVSVLYGAFLALAQRDLKRIVAYSSISSMGYVLIGLVAYTSYGLSGATFQMLSHGLLSGLLFMAVGVVYNQSHTRMVGDLSGIADRMPLTSGVFVAGAFGYMGLPLMSGFAAEYLIFQGAFSAQYAGAALLTALSMFGIVVVAGYLLWAMQRVLFGPYAVDGDHALAVAPLRDTGPLVVLLLLVVLLGVYPELVLDMIQDAVAPLAGGGA